jgi:hypothetical protein
MRRRGSEVLARCKSGQAMVAHSCDWWRGNTLGTRLADMLMNMSRLNLRRRTLKRAWTEVAQTDNRPVRRWGDAFRVSLARPNRKPANRH